MQACSRAIEEFNGHQAPIGPIGLGKAVACVLWHRNVSQKMFGDRRMCYCLPRKRTCGETKTPKLSTRGLETSPVNMPSPGDGNALRLNVYSFSSPKHIIYLLIV